MHSGKDKAMEIVKRPLLPGAGERADRQSMEESWDSEMTLCDTVMGRRCHSFVQTHTMYRSKSACRRELRIWSDVWASIHQL
jgi:hypothetical protein